MLQTPLPTDDNQPLWTTDALRRLLAHPDENVRAWALERLTLLFPDELPELLPTVLRDPSWRVLPDAMKAYEVRPTAQAREVLRQRLRDKGMPHGTRTILERLVRQDAPEPEEPDEDEARILALASDPARLRALAPAALQGEQNEARLDVMMALRRRPERWAGDLVLEHLEALLTREGGYDPWELLEEMGEVRALEAGLSWHRPGEGALAGHLVFLARLAGQEGSLPPIILAEAAERASFQQKRMQSASSAPLPELMALDEPLSLPLRCRRCHRVGEYEVKSATLDPKATKGPSEEWDGVVLGRIVRCKWCDAVDDYELSGMANLTLTSRLLPMLTARQEGAPPGPVRMASLGLWDGTRVRRPSQALGHLQALAESKPTSGEAWRRLGNLREVYEQLEGAVAAWHEAIARDPTEAEACYSLAMYHDTRREPDLAFSHVRELFARQARQQGSWPLRVDMLVEALEVALPHARTKGLPLGLRVTPPGAHEAAPTIDLRALRDVALVSVLFEQDQVPQTELTDQVVAGELGPLEALRALSSTAPTRQVVPVRSGQPKVGRNDPCPCGSGKKFKKCCGQ
jgi:hypothetical protein